MSSVRLLSPRDRVVVVGAHPWNSYTGTIIGLWPTSDLDWLVALDNGQHIGAREGDLQKVSL
jgi:hypothetical protein